MFLSQLELYMRLLGESNREKLKRNGHHDFKMKKNRKDRPARIASGRAVGCVLFGFRFRIQIRGSAAEFLTPFSEI